MREQFGFGFAGEINANMMDSLGSSIEPRPFGPNHENIMS